MAARKALANRTTWDGRTDFDDDVKHPFRPRADRSDMDAPAEAAALRIPAAEIEAQSAAAWLRGRKDLGVYETTSPGPRGNGGNGMSNYANQKADTRPYRDEIGQPTDKQRALIIKLVKELLTVDPAKGKQAAEYTLRMTQNAAWEHGRGGNTSRWIDTLLTVLKNERATAPRQTVTVVAAPSAPVKPAYDAYDDVTDGNYAIVRKGKTHFYRITRSEGRGQYAGRTFINIQERASDELFPVRGAWAVRKSVLDGIRAAGVQVSHLLYADRLGMCWHCNRTLTDDVHNPYRKYGLGPICGP
jgi:hypothetical protein